MRWGRRVRWNRPNRSVTYVLACPPSGLGKDIDDGKWCLNRPHGIPCYLRARTCASVHQRPRTSSNRPSTNVHLRPGTSTVSQRRDWLHIGYTTGQNRPCFGPKMDAIYQENNHATLGVACGYEKAEGRGLEPPTPCGAPDFESCS